MAAATPTTSTGPAISPSPSPTTPPHWYPIDVRFTNGGGGAGNTGNNATGYNENFSYELNNSANPPGAAWLAAENTPGNTIFALPNLISTVSGPITMVGDATIGSDAGSLTVSGLLTTNSHSLAVTGAGDTNLSSQISGPGTSLSKSGGGTLTLSSTSPNTYGGTTTVSGGYVYIASGTELSTGDVYVTSGATSGALQVPGGITVANALHLAGSGPTGAGAVEHVSQSVSYGPGLLEGYLSGTNNMAGNPGNGGNQLLPRAGEQSSNSTNVYPFSASDSVWEFDNITLVYDALMYIDPLTTSIQFQGSIDDGWEMSFNNAQVIGWGWNGDSGAINTTGLSGYGGAGTWVPVEFRFENGGGGAGANGDRAGTGMRRCPPTCKTPTPGRWASTTSSTATALGSSRRTRATAPSSKSPAISAP